MLSIAPGRLAHALGASQQSKNTTTGINRRFLATNTSGSGSSGKRPDGSYAGNRNSGNYKYQQAFDPAQADGNVADMKTGNGGRRVNLEERRKSSQARFAGGGSSGNKEGGGGSKSYGAVRGREGGERMGGMKMPSMEYSGRTTIEEVRASRERLEGGGISRLGKPGLSTFNSDGDDRMLSLGGASGSGGREGGNRGGYGRGSGGYGRGGGGARGSARGPSRGPARPPGSKPPTGAAASGRPGGRPRESEEGEDPNAKLTTGYGADAPQGKMSRKTARRLAEMTRLQDAAEAEEEKLDAKKQVKLIDDDLRKLKNVEEVDEQGEERLLVDRVDEDEEVDLAAIAARNLQQVLGSEAIVREINSDIATIESLPDASAYQAKKWKDRSAASAASSFVDQVARRSIENATPKPLTMDELNEADEMDYILDPETLETPLDLEEEQILMETQFSFGHGQNDVTLHSEKGLLYGVVDLFDRMVVDKKKLLIAKARKLKRFQIWRAISWAKREKKIKVRNDRKKRIIKQAREAWAKNAADPNMHYYPSLHLWFSSDELRQDVIRNAISAALANPSWQRQKRRDFLIGVKSDLVKISQPLPAHKQKVLDTIYNVPKRPVPTETRTTEHQLTLPISDWSLMLAQAERAMEPADRLKRFDPSPYEKKNNIKL